MNPGSGQSTDITDGDGHYRSAPTVLRTIDIPDESISEAVARAARKNPARTALYFMGAKTNYLELGKQVQQAASALSACGVRAGDRVALSMPNCPAHVVSFLAVLRLGAVVVELNPLATAEELRSRLTNSGSTWAIAWQPTSLRIAEVIEQTPVKQLFSVDISRDLPLTKRLALRLPIARARSTRAQLTSPTPSCAQDWHRFLARSQAKSLRDIPLPKAEDLALLIYTGGTTGDPQAAMLTHRNLVSNAVQGEEWTSLSADDSEPAIMYGVLPLFHAYGMTLTLAFGLRVGGTLVLFPKFSAEEVIATQRRIPGTFMAAVPPMLDRIVAAAAEQKRKPDFSSMSYVLSGAMPLSQEGAARWEELTGGYVIEGYGMTECSPVALGNPVSDQRRPGWLGLPFPNTEIKVVDQDDPTREVSAGERGELLIHGPQVFAGYWGEDPDNRPWRIEIDGQTWLRTGDIVIQDESGFVKLVDRIKELIVTGGFKVYPSHVEAVLRQMPGILDAAVVGLPGGDLGEEVVAALVLPPEATDEDAPQLPDIDLPHVGVPHIDLSHVELPKVDLPKVELPHIDLSRVELPHVELPKVDIEAVRRWCAEHLSRYAIPRKIVIVSELPKSQIGKVMRRVVRDDILNQSSPDVQEEESPKQL